MPIPRPIRKAIKKLAFGDSLLPQEFTIGLPEPQTEVIVWLRGTGIPVDVTYRYTTACAAPLILCIAVDRGQEPAPKDYDKLLLEFREGQGQKRILGKIRVAVSMIVPAGDLELVLLKVCGSTNYCLPRVRLWAHYLLQAYSQQQSSGMSDMKMSFLEQRAAMVTFIRPHPLALVSVTSDEGGNIFPMNLMGELGHGYFAFALKRTRMAAQLVERARRIAVSSLPLPHSWLAFRLAINHTKRSIDWNELPFAVKMSREFKIPFPVFASRVREMEIAKILEIGSHRFFIARIISEETFSDCPAVNVVHGFYQCWRLRGQRAELKASVAQDFMNKREPSPQVVMRDEEKPAGRPAADQAIGSTCRLGGDCRDLGGTRHCT